MGQFHWAPAPSGWRASTRARRCSPPREALGDRPVVELLPGRLEDPLPPGPFDLVVSALAVHHLDGPGKAGLFARLAGMLATDGRIVIADVVIPEDPGRSPARCSSSSPSWAPSSAGWTRTRAATWDSTVGWVVRTVLALVERQWGFLLLESVWGVVSAWGLLQVIAAAARPRHTDRMPDHDPLPTRTLGDGGPAVGAIGLGCMGMSWGYGAADRDDDRSVAVIRRALELGVTLIDTADMYGPFHNEELVGRALDGHRDEAVLATKCGLVVQDAATYSMARDGRPEHVRAALEASLGRLRTDVVDLYQLHRVDEKVPIEETWGAMAELVQAGHVKAIGLSEVDVAQLERAARIHPVATVQSELSLWTRDALAAVLPWCKAHGAAFIPFSPLGRGFLSGKLDVAAIGAEDFRRRMPRFQAEAAERNLAIVDRVREIASRHEATPAQVALSWVLAQGAQVIPIPGTKRREYLEENAGAARLALGPDDMAHLDELPAPVGTRY